MRRSTGQTWLVCAVMSIGIYALSAPYAYRTTATSSTFPSDIDSPAHQQVAETSSLQSSYPVMETPSFHISDQAPRADEASLEETQTAPTGKETDALGHEDMLTLAGQSSSPVIRYPDPASPALDSSVFPVMIVSGGEEATDIDPLPVMLNGKAHSDKSADSVGKEMVLAYTPPTKKPHKTYEHTIKVGKGDTCPASSSMRAFPLLRPQTPSPPSRPFTIPAASGPDNRSRLPSALRIMGKSTAITTDTSTAQTVMTRMIPPSRA